MDVKLEKMLSSIKKVKKLSTGLDRSVVSSFFQVRDMSMLQQSKVSISLKPLTKLDLASIDYLFGIQQDSLDEVSLTSLELYAQAMKDGHEKELREQEERNQYEIRKVKNCKDQFNKVFEDEVIIHIQQIENLAISMDEYCILCTNLDAEELRIDQFKSNIELTYMDICRKYKNETIDNFEAGVQLFREAEKGIKGTLQHKVAMDYKMLREKLRNIISTREGYHVKYNQMIDSRNTLISIIEKMKLIKFDSVRMVDVNYKLDERLVLGILRGTLQLVESKMVEIDMPINSVTEPSKLERGTDRLIAKSFSEVRDMSMRGHVKEINSVEELDMIDIYLDESEGLLYNSLSQDGVYGERKMVEIDMPINSVTEPSKLERVLID
jgi:hypothetical protein